MRDERRNCSTSSFIPHPSSLGNPMPRPQYQNPLSPMSFPDPAAIKFRGEYIAYATGESVDGRIFPIMTSPDAVHWTFRGGAMRPLPDPQANEYWAPEVAYCSGLF